MPFILSKNFKFKKIFFDIMPTFTEVLMQETKNQKTFFIGFVILVFIGIIYLYQKFLVNFCVACLVCLSIFGLKHFFLKFSRSNFIASFLSVSVFLLCFALPLLFLAQQAIKFFSHLNVGQAEFYLNASKEGIAKILLKFPYLESFYNDLSGRISTQDLVNFGFKISSYIGKESFQFLLDIMFIAIFLFALFYYARSFYILFLRMMPFSFRQSQYIYEEVSGVLKIVLFASLINLVLQGLAFGIFIKILDYQNATLLGVLYGIASLIPVVGGLVVWLPVVGYEIYLGNLYQAIAIAIYSIVFIAFIIDSVIKPFIIGLVNRKMLKKPLKVNELLIFFAIFAGFGSFGFWGLVIGPAITSLFISILRLYRQRK